MSKKAASPSVSGFGGYLRALRAERHLTLREVSAAVGMDQAHLSKAELNQRLPTPAQVSALARFFRQDLVEFEAHCIAEKFRRRHAGSAAALHAIRLLHGEQQLGGTTIAVRTSARVATKKAKSVVVPPLPEPSSLPESIPEESRGVTVLHLD